MATPSAAELNAQYQSREIPLELLDEPTLPERETMEETDLADLALNIAEIGLIKPLVVKAVGDRFEVTAGHRRLLACRLANYSPVPCRVQSAGDVDPLAVLIAENGHVESVNPVEEARFYQRVLVERCGNDVDVLCIKVRRRREYVEDRLNLLRGDSRVVEALWRKRISLAVARELNKIKDPNRLLLLLDVSIEQGATARQVAQWRKDSAQLDPLNPADSDPADQATNPMAIAAGYRMECMFCEDTDDPHLMEMFYLHKPCKKIVLKMLGRGAGEIVQGAN
jgi:ParB family transcriptional regulator, chromosome partitioning protein